MKTDMEALKALRKERGDALARARSLLKTRAGTMREVKKCIAERPATVPEVAKMTGLKPSEVLWCISGLRKYGMAVECDKDGDYFRYRTVAETEAS
jgi:hypothetical protein